MKKKDFLVGRPYPGSPFQAHKDSVPCSNSCCGFTTKGMMKSERERESESSKSVASSRLAVLDVCNNAKRR